MIKFEEHVGLLFRMLEEHEIMPLKENDEECSDDLSRD